MAPINVSASNGLVWNHAKRSDDRAAFTIAGEARTDRMIGVQCLKRTNNRPKLSLSLSIRWYSFLTDGCCR